MNPSNGDWGVTDAGGLRSHRGHRLGLPSDHFRSHGDAVGILMIGYDRIYDAVMEILWSIQIGYSLWYINSSTLAVIGVGRLVKPLTIGDFQGLC